jgi:hypothetical protein
MGSIFTPIRSDKGTSCRYENAEARGLLESPLTPALSPLEQGGRGYGSGRILPAKSPFGAAEQGWLVYTLIKNHAGEPIFRTPSRL